MSNVYLAARYSRREEIADHAEALESLGYKVTSRWLLGDHQIDAAGKPISDAGEDLVENGEGEEAAKLRAHFAIEDVEDVRAANTIILFTEEPYSVASRGGRHVEFGIAIERGMNLIVIGPHEHVFTWLPDVQQYDTWADFFELLLT